MKLSSFQCQYRLPLWKWPFAAVIIGAAIWGHREQASFRHIIICLALLVREASECELIACFSAAALLYVINLYWSTVLYA